MSTANRANQGFCPQRVCNEWLYIRAHLFRHSVDDNGEDEKLSCATLSEIHTYVTQEWHTLNNWAQSSTTGESYWEQSVDKAV